MKRNEKSRDGMDRRSFIRTLGSGSAVAAAAAAAPIVAATDAEAYDPGAEQRKARYKETDHVKAFYRVNRYPS